MMTTAWPCAMVQHTVAAIKAARLVMDPYPHVQVFNVFPDALYACMMQKLPPGRGGRLNTCITPVSSFAAA